MKRQYFLLIFYLLAVTACKNQKQPEAERTITVTIEPLRYFTEQIAGDKYKVISMVPKGSSPETYDPTPKQLIELSKSDAYFQTGYIGFEQTWMNKIRENNPSMKIFDTSHGINLIKASHSHENSPKVQSTIENKKEIEPHLWNSPANALIIATNIRNALSELDQENAPYYAARFDSLEQIIKNTDRELKSLLQNSDSIFMIYHPALSYFARDYNLQQISIEEGGKEPSSAHLKELIKKSKEKGVNVIFVQQEFDTRNAEIIAKETNAKIVPINPLSYDWQKEMISTAKALHHE